MGQQRGVDGIAHVAALDEHLWHRRQVEPGKVVAKLDAVDTVIGAGRHPGDPAEVRAHVVTERLG